MGRQLLKLTWTTWRRSHGGSQALILRIILTMALRRIRGLLTATGKRGGRDSSALTIIFRQRRMRVNESGAGLTGQSAILSQNRLTGAMTGTIPTLGGGQGAMMDKILSGPPPAKRDAEPSGITVMTHEKRIYSNKVGWTSLILLL